MMIGVCFSYPDEVDKFRHPPWTELRCSRIEPGPPNRVWSKGDAYEVSYYWRNWDISLEERTRLMNEIVKDLVRSHKVNGFTLWWNDTKQNWQMNVRREGEAWGVSFISQAEAEAIFAILQASHPEGPWKVRPDYVQDDAKAAEEVEKMNTSSAAYRREESLTDSLPTYERSDSWPYVKRVEIPLDVALKRAAEAVGRAEARLARLMP